MPRRRGFILVNLTYMPVWRMIAGRGGEQARGSVADGYTEKMATAIKLVEPAGNEFLAELEKKSNRANHFFRIMANRTDVLKNFVPFYGAITGAGPVDRRTKELVYLTVSYANECAYCT